MTVKTTKALPLSIHKTFERDDSGQRHITVYASDGGPSVKLTGVKLEKLFASLRSGSTLRTTQVHGCDPQLMRLHEGGVAIIYSRWHDLGIPKGSDGAAIAQAVANADGKLFRQFLPRPDLMNLREVLSLRNALLQCYGGALRAIKQAGRNGGLLTDEEMAASPTFKGAMDGIKNIKKSIGVSENNTSLDTEIANIAKNIPECVLFNRIAGIKDSWISAASVMAYCGGVDRFGSVAAFWKFFGQHVDEGSAPKRKRGVPSSWNPAGRTAVYLLGDAIIKNRKNPWRKFYDDARAEEMSVHELKHPGIERENVRLRAENKRLKQEQGHGRAMAKAVGK